MKLTIRYDYKTDYAYPYHATAVFDNKRLVGVSKENFEDAEQDLLKIIAEIKREMVNIQIPEPKEIEL